MVSWQQEVRHILNIFQSERLIYLITSQPFQGQGTDRFIIVMTFRKSLFENRGIGSHATYAILLDQLLKLTCTIISRRIKSTQMLCPRVSSSNNGLCFMDYSLYNTYFSFRCNPQAVKNSDRKEESSA